MEGWRADSKWSWQAARIMCSPAISGLRPAMAGKHLPLHLFQRTNLSHCTTGSKAEALSSSFLGGCAPPTGGSHDAGVGRMPWSNTFSLCPYLPCQRHWHRTPATALPTRSLTERHLTGALSVYMASPCCLTPRIVHPPVFHETAQSGPFLSYGGTLPFPNTSDA